MKNTALKQRYASIASDWNSSKFDQIRRDDLLPEIVKWAKIKKLPRKSKILDAMCGTGTVGRHIFIETVKHPTKHCEIVYQDFSKEMLKQIPPGEKKYLSDICELPFPDNYFERVFLRCSIHDLEKEKQAQAIKEIKRVLKENEIFVCSTFYVDQTAQPFYNMLLNLKDALAGYSGRHCRYFPTLTELWEMFRLSGFRHTEIRFNFRSQIAYEKTELIGREESCCWEIFLSSLPYEIKKIMGIKKKDGYWQYNLPGVIFQAIK